MFSATNKSKRLNNSTEIRRLEHIISGNLTDRQLDLDLRSLAVLYALH